MVAHVRALLMDQPGASQDAEGCRQLGGVSVGGWIVLGVLMGFMCGIASTLLFQWYQRRKEERYLLQVPPAPPAQTLDFSKQSSMADVGMAAAADYRLPALHASAAAMPGRALRPQKYYSPLTKSLSVGPGGMSVIGEDMRSSMRLSEAGGGDTTGKGRSDQQPLAEVHGHPLPAAQAPRTATVTHRVQLHTSQQTRPVDPTAYAHRTVVGSTQVPCSIPASSPDSSDPDYSASYQKLPVSITHSNMPECLPSPTPEASRNFHAAMPLSSDAGTTHSPAATEQQPGASSGGQHRQQHGTESAAPKRSMHAESSTVDVDDAYEEHELDDDWKKLLGDVDSRLLAQNQHAMDARERSVAIKKLLVATGTRGVDFAMNAALREVLQFRKLHGK